MPAFEIHVETYTVEEIPIVEADSAYEAAISYVARWAPCTIRRIRETEQDDVFVVHAIGSRGDGIEVEVFEHDPELA